MTMLGRKHSPKTIEKLSGKNNSRYSKLEVTCLRCGKNFHMKPFHIKNGRGKFCSKTCKYETMKERRSWNAGLKGFRAKEKSHLWKGGITPLAFAIRTSFEYRKWRTSIFQRDRYTCQECLTVGCRLHVHHKIQFSVLLKNFLNTNFALSPIYNKLELIKLSASYQEFWDTNNGVTLCEKCHHMIPKI